MKTQLVKRASFAGNYHKRQVVDTEGNRHDYSVVYLTPQKHHVIITTEDGYKLALNPYNGIAYRIIGEKYN